MARLSRRELEEQLQCVEEILDEIAAVLTDEDLSAAKKLEAVNELIFDEQEEDG